MLRRDLRFGLLVARTVAAIVGVLVCLVVEIGRPYPGFFFSSDFRVFPVDAGGPHGRPRVRRPHRGRGRRLAHFTDGPRRGRSRPHPLRGRARRPALQPRAGAGHVHAGPVRRPLRRLLRRVRGHAGGGALRLRPESRRRSEPELPRLHVSLGRVQRGRARGRAGAEEVRGHPGELRAAAPVRPRLGLLPDVSGEPRAPGLAGRSTA